MRSTWTRPAPRSSRVLAPSVRIPQPVLAAIRPASSRQRWRRASPPISRVARSPLRSIAAAALTAASETFGGAAGGAVSAMPSAAPQAVSAGRIRVAICPGVCRAACDRQRTIGRNRARVGRGLDPMRHGRRHALDIRGQRGVVGDVIGGVLADDVDDAGVGLLGVVQVGQPIGEAGAQVQQGGRRPSQHAVVAVGRARHHALEQAQHAAHARHLVQGGHEMHLRRAGIGEADVHSAREQGPHQTFSPIHLVGHVL